MKKEMAFPGINIVQKGDPAYNGPSKIYYSGMTLRDFFAGQALSGIAATSAHPNSPSIEGQARMSYEMADAMMKVRVEVESDD